MCGVGRPHGRLPDRLDHIDFSTVHVCGTGCWLTGATLYFMHLSTLCFFAHVLVKARVWADAQRFVAVAQLGCFVAPLIFMFLDKAAPVGALHSIYPVRALQYSILYVLQMPFGYDHEPVQNQSMDLLRVSSKGRDTGACQD